jgi:hypothetical protein
VRQGVRAKRARDLDLPLRDERPRDRGAQQVLAVVDRARAQGGEDEVPDELLAQVLDIALLGARRQRLFAHAGKLLRPLANVGGDADDARVVLLAQPRNNDRSIKPAGIREHNRLHERSRK